MQAQRIITSSTVNDARKSHAGGSSGERPYMRFQCVCCSHSISPGMFTARGWEIYKKTELCPYCQKLTLSMVENDEEEESYDGGRTSEKPYEQLRCVRCNHCLSPGMFSAEGWAIYKQSGLCPDCQE